MADKEFEDVPIESIADVEPLFESDKTEYIQKDIDIKIKNGEGHASKKIPTKRHIKCDVSIKEPAEGLWDITLKAETKGGTQVLLDKKKFKKGDTGRFECQFQEWPTFIIDAYCDDKTKKTKLVLHAEIELRD